MEYRKAADAFALAGSGYLFLYFQFNLFTLDMMPDWVCYVFLLLAIREAAPLVPSLKLLRLLGILLGVWEGILWVSTALNVSLAVPLVEVLVDVMAIYFHYQFLTDLARLATKFKLPEREKLFYLRTVMVVLITLLALPVNWQEYFLLALPMALAGVVTGLWVCLLFFRFRRQLLTRAEA